MAKGSSTQKGREKGTFYFRGDGAPHPKPEGVPGKGGRPVPGVRSQIRSR